MTVDKTALFDISPVCLSAVCLVNLSPSVFVQGYQRSEVIRSGSSSRHWDGGRSELPEEVYIQIISLSQSHGQTPVFSTLLSATLQYLCELFPFDNFPYIVQYQWDLRGVKGELDVDRIIANRRTAQRESWTQTQMKLSKR